MTNTNNLLNKKYLLPILFASSLLSTSVTKGALLVDWGGDYVSSNQSLQAGGFSGNNATGIAPLSGYNGNSAAIYGKIEADSGITESIIEDNAGTDEINIGASTGENVFALILWQPGTMSFSPGDTLTINRVFSGSGVKMRLVLQDTTGTYYIGSTNGTDFAGTPFDLTNISFFNYDPVGTGTVDDPASFVGANLDFSTTEFTSIGYNVRLPSGTTPKSLSMLEFEVNGTLAAAVPEPSTYALLLGLSSLGLIVYRCKKKSIPKYSKTSF